MAHLIDAHDPEKCEAVFRKDHAQLVVIAAILSLSFASVQPDRMFAAPRLSDISLLRWPALSSKSRSVHRNQT
jgi:hypothetical protein